MSLIVGGRREETPFPSANWIDRPELRLTLPEDGKIRSGWGTEAGPEIRALVAHSTKGWPTGKHPAGGNVVPGVGPASAGPRVFEFWRNHDDRAGAHVTIAGGVVWQGADLLSEMTYHCPGVNAVTVGAEIYQGPEGEFHDGNLDAWADFAAWFCQRFGLPLRAQWPYPRRGGRPRAGIVEARGVYGHRDASANRGWGDPGDAPILRLRDRAGFVLCDLLSGEPAPSGEPPEEWKEEEGSSPSPAAPEAAPALPEADPGETPAAPPSS